MRQRGDGESATRNTFFLDSTFFLASTTICTLQRTYTVFWTTVPRLDGCSVLLVTTIQVLAINLEKIEYFLLALWYMLELPGTSQTCTVTLLLLGFLSPTKVLKNQTVSFPMFCYYKFYFNTFMFHLFYAWFYLSFCPICFVIIISCVDVTDINSWCQIN